ncbi:MAG: patatin-like phospholipase family protein [Brevundimonas sp.]|uniref:patatin-like phospholipase family protein n=1 Tax=Brevundimonas sp. TaxID=1871086 RepID=UPI0030024FC8
MIRIIAAVLLSLAVGACAGSPRLPFELDHRLGATPGVAQAVTGSPLRSYVDGPDRLAAFQRAFDEGVPLGPDGVLDFIALSGGGANGAFSAGVMKGWSESGTRPDFEVVTGVSAGALAAPFVFLGSDWDDELEAAFTGGDATNLLQSQGLGVFVGSGLYQAEPLRALIERHVDERLLRAVAEEHAKGRILLVATTDLDSQRGVSWDLGAIAALGTPEALQLFRTVLLASASIPGVFPPVMIPSVSGDARFDEMHVDGGVTTPFLAIPEALWALDDPHAGLAGARFHVIVNGRTAPEFSVTQDSMSGVLGRSVDALLLSSLTANLAGNRAFAIRHGIYFRYAALPDDAEHSALDFSTEGMRAVFEIGRQGALDGSIWR